MRYPLQGHGCHRGSMQSVLPGHLVLWVVDIYTTTHTWPQPHIHGHNRTYTDTTAHTRTQLAHTWTQLTHTWTQLTHTCSQPMTLYMYELFSITF